MLTAEPNRSLDELAELGSRVFEQTIKPRLRDEDQGKFVAIDVRSGDYELDADDYSAVTRLRTRKPAGEVWLMRVGSPTTYRMGATR